MTFTLPSALIDYRRKIRILLKILLSYPINFKQHINHDCNHFPEKHKKTFKELSKTNIPTSLRKLLILKPFKLVSFLQSQFSFLLNKPIQSHFNIIISYNLQMANLWQFSKLAILFTSIDISCKKLINFKNKN